MTRSIYSPVKNAHWNCADLKEVSYLASTIAVKQTDLSRIIAIWKMLVMTGGIMFIKGLTRIYVLEKLFSILSDVFETPFPRNFSQPPNLLFVIVLPDR